MERAARLFGAAERLREVSGLPLTPDEKVWNDRGIPAARTLLGDRAFAAAWDEGRALFWEQAVAYALEETSVSA